MNQLIGFALPDFPAAEEGTEALLGASGVVPGRLGGLRKGSERAPGGFGSGQRSPGGSGALWGAAWGPFEGLPGCRGSFGRAPGGLPGTPGSSQRAPGRVVGASWAPRGPQRKWQTIKIPVESGFALARRRPKGSAD